MDRNQKQNAVEKLKKPFVEANAVVLTHYIGLNASEITELRSVARDAGAKFLVTKNSLAKIALKETQYEGLMSFFIGPTALVFSEDPIAGIKVVKKFSKDNNKLKVIKASLNERIIDDEEFVNLSNLPSLQEIRASIAGYLTVPHQNVLQLFKAVGSDLVNIFNKQSKK